MADTRSAVADLLPGSTWEMSADMSQIENLYLIKAAQRSCGNAAKAKWTAPSSPALKTTPEPCPCNLQDQRLSIVLARIRGTTPLLQCNNSSNHSLDTYCQVIQISFGRKPLLLQRQMCALSSLPRLQESLRASTSLFFKNWSLSDFRSELMDRYFQDFFGKPGGKCH